MFLKLMSKMFMATSMATKTIIYPVDIKLILSYIVILYIYNFKLSI